jgi:hypothetical protein
LTDEHVVALVTGVAAVGKSTVGDLLARRFARAPGASHGFNEAARV